MKYNENAHNKVRLSGVIIADPTYSHDVFGEAFYEAKISVDRLSDQCDVLPVTISERLIADNSVKVGSRISIEGQFRSYNKMVDDRSKLMLTVFAREVIKDASEKSENTIELSGFVCKPPIYRTTPFNREICDLLVAVNRAYNKSDYIPCIAWGRNARFCKCVSVGEKVALTGRIQSREYQKRDANGEVQTRVAFEVSINKINAFNDEDEEEKSTFRSSNFVDYRR